MNDIKQNQIAECKRIRSKIDILLRKRSQEGKSFKEQVEQETYMILLGNGYVL